MTAGTSRLNTRSGVHSPQVLHGQLTLSGVTRPLHISAVYAKCPRADRYPLWEKLCELAALSEDTPWAIGGDFNTILHPHDRIGSESNRSTEMIDFAETLEDCRQLDPDFDGANYTWAKNSLFERLDRIFLNEAWSLSLPKYVDPPPQFLDVICDDWSQDMGAGGLLNLQMKLARLKKTLKTWNKEVFGNVQANLKATEELIVEAQTNFEADHHRKTGQPSISTLQPTFSP
ncbi:uncharacterized protein LOC121774389 [Salvia splendens]|uniref:uncharacterized protein LOC121774389 n=1 Tax=Salvia splendens TaxID=180675 RepID=UPI001C263DE3|nr:uncharacterized protein LOC121774389 [Salvia splendens]